MGLLAQLKKLTKYYELVIYTILPREIVNQFYNLVPGIEDYISHTLCYEDLTFSEADGLAYKDLALLAHNRLSHHTNENQIFDYQSSFLRPLDGSMNAFANSISAAFFS